MGYSEMQRDSRILKGNGKEECPGHTCGSQPLLTDPIHVPSPVYGYQNKEMAEKYKRVERPLSPEETFKLQEKIFGFLP